MVPSSAVPTVPLIVTLATVADAAGAGFAAIAYFASAFSVTVTAASPATFSAGIVMAIASAFATVGVPLIVITASVASASTFALILASRPVGRFVNHAATSSSAFIATNFSFAKVIVTSLVPSSAVPTVPLIVTLPTLAVVPSANAMLGMKHAIIMMLMSIANSFFISFSFLFTVGLCFVMQSQRGTSLG